MAEEYYVVYDGSKGRWEIQIPEDVYSGRGSYVVQTFETKEPAMSRARELAKNQSARLVENAKKGYTMQQYDYTTG